MAARRIQKEHKDFIKVKGTTSSAGPIDRVVLGGPVESSDLFQWRIVIRPPMLKLAPTCLSNALYGVVVVLRVEFPSDYPFKPPRETFCPEWSKVIERGRGLSKLEYFTMVGLESTSDDCPTTTVDATTTTSLSPACKMELLSLEYEEIIQRRKVEIEILKEFLEGFQIVLGPEAPTDEMKRVATEVSQFLVVHKETGLIRDKAANSHHGMRQALDRNFERFKDAPELAYALNNRGKSEVVGGQCVIMKTLIGKAIPFWYKSGGTMSVRVEHVKCFMEIEESFNGDLEKAKKADAEQRMMASDDLQVIFAGKKLEPGRVLGDYAVQGGSCVGDERVSTIHILRRLRGCEGSVNLLGFGSKEEWSPAKSVSQWALCNPGKLQRAVFGNKELGETMYCSSCRAAGDPVVKRLLSFTEGDKNGSKRSLDELGRFHWQARCIFPSPLTVWTPETDKYWPMLFRKIIRYCLKIRVQHHQRKRGSPKFSKFTADEAMAMYLPHEIVAEIGQYL